MHGFYTGWISHFSCAQCKLCRLASCSGLSISVEKYPWEMPLAPGTDDSMMLVILLSCVCWVSVYSNSLTRRQRREMGILPSCHSLEEFFRETIKHNAIIVSAESPYLPRMTLAPVHDEKQETNWFKLYHQGTVLQPCYGGHQQTYFTTQTQTNTACSSVLSSQQSSDVN